MGVIFGLVGVWFGHRVWRAVLKVVMKSGSMHRRRISGMLVVILMGCSRYSGINGRWEEWKDLSILSVIDGAWYRADPEA